MQTVEETVTLDALERHHGLAEHVLGGGVGSDGRVRPGKDRDEERDEEGVAQGSVRDHEDRAEERVEVRRLVDSCDTGGW